MIIQLSSESKGKKKGKKKKSGRSLMLSEIMPLLSGSLGEKIQSAIENEDGERVQMLMKQVGKQLRKKYEAKNN
ncbi:MAG: hypothetical protein ACRC6V_03820 [Bacteroidales bacterium]